jgi:hypothetical protein
MSTRILFPSAIDYIREINDNLVDNALGGRAAFVQLPNLYNRAYMIVHETGTARIRSDLQAPDENVRRQRGVNIFSERSR